MKKQLRSVFCLLLAALLLAAVPAAVARAADYSWSMNIDFTVGVYKQWCIDQIDLSTSQYEGKGQTGSCPGLSVYFNQAGDGLFIGGTPTEAGNFTVVVTAYYNDNTSSEITVNCHVAAAAQPSPSPSPEVVVVETPAPTLKITKDPTGETVVEGENAVFIARCDNATEIVWQLVSADGKTTYLCSDAPNYFTGLRVTGLGTERLELQNIPMSLNGWRAQAKFNGPGGPLYSKGAPITVVLATLDTPTIVVQPKDAQATAGSSAVLSVGASANEGELHYQWYKSSSNRNVGGQAIVGATGASYAPAENEGTYYYYVTVWAVNGTRSSNSVTSAVAKVSFAPQATPTPEATPTPTPEQVPVSEPTPEQAAPTEAPAAPSNTTQESSSRGGSATVTLLIIAVILLFGAVVALTVYILLRRRYQDDD